MRAVIMCNEEEFKQFKRKKERGTRYWAEQVGEDAYNIFVNMELPSGREFLVDAGTGTASKESQSYSNKGSE